MSNVPSIKKKMSTMGYYNSCDFSGRTDEEFDKAIKYFQSENFDKDGKPLVVDGICGTRTRWAVDYLHSIEAFKMWHVRKDLLEKQIVSFFKARTLQWSNSKGAKSGKDFFTETDPNVEFMVYDNEFKFENFKLVDGVYLLIKDKTPPKSNSRAYLRSFEGVGVVVKVEGGAFTVLGMPFRAASHPGQSTTTARGTPDVDGDSEKDVAWLIPNLIYPFYGKRTGSKKRFNPVGYYSPVNRDYKDKGWLNEGEKRRVFKATAVQFHDDSGTGRPTSVGCITAPLEDYNRAAKWIEEQKVDKMYGLFRYYG